MNTDLSAYLIPYHGLRPSCSPKPMLHSSQRKYFTSIESMPDIEDEEFTELLKSLILISNAYIQNFKISTYVPYAMEQAFENDMRSFSEWFAESIAEAYQKSLNQGFDVHKAMQSAAEQAERGLSSLAVKLGRYDNEIKTFNTFDYYWDRGYTRCLFVSEQGEHTCDRCQSYHGKVLSSREVPIPPLHPHCRCELILLDTRAESLYYMNRRGFLEAFQRARRGPAGGLFLLDHDFFQDGMSPSSLTRLTLPNGHVVIDVYAPEIDNSDEQYYQYMERWAGTYFAGLVRDANEMLEAILQAQDDRSRHKWDSLGAFFDWVTLGIVSGTWQGFVDRHMAMVENPSFYNILNAVLLGLPDQLKDTVAPEEPWSLEHWLNIIETALLVYSAYKISVSVKNALAEGMSSSVGRQALIDEVIASGYKITPDNVVWIMKTDEGKIVWLETGTARAGLQHILTHASQFVQNGIAVEDISDFIKYTITNGKIVGIQNTRPVYEVTYNGVVQTVAIDISDNGFIVGANINHHFKPLEKFVNSIRYNSNSFGSNAETGSAGCRALNRKFIVTGEMTMKKKLRFLFDYGTYPLWWFDGIDPTPECKIPDDCWAKELVTELMNEHVALFINNKREFSYVGFQSKEDETAFIRKLDEAISLLKQQYGQEYEIIDDSGLEFPRENQMK